ncbi:MAD2 mitotic arrest deficient-like 2 [Linnemannia zychae]|nr:MAD2 mitotic arrest deficient-like 2 [Linnemannia zychae]
MSEQNGSVVEVAFHMILFIRGLYPPELFESTQKYSCPIKTARHPGLKNYIQEIIQSIRTELVKDTIHRICIVTLDPSTKPIDRFVFEMSILEAFEESHFQHLQTTQLLHDAHLTNINIRTKEESYHEARNPSRVDKGKNKDRSISKGKAKAKEYHHYHDHINMEEDNEANADGLYDDNPENNHGSEESRGDRDVEIEEAARDGYRVEEEEEDAELPLAKRTRLQDSKRTTFADTVSLTTSQRMEKRDAFYHPLSRDRNRAIPHFGAKVDLTTDLEMMLRAMLLKICICDAYLTPLAPECSFTVVVEMKSKGQGPEAKPDFPWSPISTTSPHERLKLSNPLTFAHALAHSLPLRKIIPVKTVDVADIQLELYLEKFGN